MTLESTGSAHQGPATERWILSPSMQLGELDAHSATIYLESAGSRVRISRSLYTLLLAFEESGTIVPSTELSAGAARALEGLGAKGFLVPERELGMSIAPRPTPRSAVAIVRLPGAGDRLRAHRRCGAGSAVRSG